MFDSWLDRAASRHAAACLVLTLLTLAAALPGLTTLFPMDRDEPRFAQASKQMLETGDFVAIRFQDEARNKKPVGIYWLQAGAVALGETLGVPEARTRIALYRLPSLCGALAAVLLTYWAALPLTTRKGAVAAGAMMATSLILVVEAHLAKTDAALLATVPAAMGVLGRAFFARARRVPLSWPLAAVFWTAIAAGILIKGPITPMVVLFAALALSIRARSAAWLTALRPLPGLLWCLLLAAPWFILIVKASGTAFFAESLGHDMGAKIATAQESHGAPAGTYAAVFWLTGWPFAPFALFAAPIVWRDRRSDQVAFLLAWLVPTWLLFETVPTKLPHYVMPTYPALAILIAASLQKGFGPLPPRGLRLWLFGVALALVPALLPVALALAPGRLASTIDTATLTLGLAATALAAAAVATAVRAAHRQRWDAALTASIFAGLSIYAFVFGWMMTTRHADLIAISPRLVAAGEAAVGPGCAAPAFATVGYREPSLVFLTGTDLVMTDAAGAARFMGEGGCRVAFVDRPDEEDFQSALADKPAVALATRVVGSNVNGGGTLDIGVYVRQDGTP